MRSASLKKRLGDILVNVGLINNEQLNEALNIQMQKGGKLGTILAQMGVVNEEVMLAFLGKQCGISYVSLHEFGEIATDVLLSLPENLIRLQTLLPIAKEGNRLTVAMADPFNILAIDDIKLITGCDVQVVIGSETEIKAAIERYYASKESLEAMVLADSTDKESDGSAEGSVNNPIYALLAHSLKNGASELYLEPQGDYVRVRCRIQGILREQYHMSNETAKTVSRKLKADLGLPSRLLPQEGMLQTCVEGQLKDFQISFAPASLGERIYLKSLSGDPSLVDIGRLGMEHDILSIYREAIEPASGIVLITGPQKSGRTTTLLATLAQLNHPDRDIVCIDSEPHTLRGITHVQSRPHEGLSSFELTSAYLRQSPDVIACGDVTDPATAELLFHAALSGQYVVAVMNAASTLDAFVRVKNFGIEGSLVASTLLMVLNQRLLRTVCLQCKTSYEVPASLLNTMGIETPQGEEKITLSRGAGCPRCSGSGYGGVTGIFELLKMTPALRDAVAKDMLPGAKGSPAGRLTLREELWKKVCSGVTSAEEFMRLMRL